MSVQPRSTIYGEPALQHPRKDQEDRIIKGVSKVSKQAVSISGLRELALRVISATALIVLAGVVLALMHNPVGIAVGVIVGIGGMFFMASAIAHLCLQDESGQTKVMEDAMRLRFREGTDPHGDAPDPAAEEEAEKVAKMSARDREVYELKKALALNAAAKPERRLI